MWTPTPPLAVRRTPRPGPVRVCVCSSFLDGSGGQASLARSGAPHLFLSPPCFSALLGPLRAWAAPFLVLCLAFFPPSFCLFSFRCCFPRALFVSCFLWLPAPAALGCGAVCCLSCWPCASRLSVRSCLVGCSAVVAPLPPLCLAVFVAAAQCLVFFFPLVCAPVLSGFPWFPAMGALGLGAVLFFSLASRFSALSALSPVSCVLLGRWLLPGGRCLPPRPLLCLAVFVATARCLFFFLFLCAPPLSLAFSGLRPWVPWALALCFVCFVGLPLPGLPCALALFVCPAWLLAAPWCLLPPPPPFSVSRSSSLPLGPPFLFFSRVVRPRCLLLSLVSSPGCPRPRRCALFALLASRLSALPALSPLSRFLPGRWLFPGGCCPPLLRLAVFFAAALCCVSCAVLCCVSLSAVLRCAAARCAARCCAVVCCVVLLRSFGAAA